MGIGMRWFASILIMAALAAATPSPAEADCSYRYSCRGCRHFGLPESGSSDRFPNYQSCAADLARSRQRARKLQNFTPYDCQCSGGGGSGRGGSGGGGSGSQWSPQQQFAQDIGAVVGAWLTQALSGPSPGEQRDAALRKRQRAALRGFHSRVIKDHRLVESRRRYPDPGFRNQAPAQAWTEDADATGVVNRDAELAAECPDGYVGNHNTRRFVGCCPANAPILSIPQHFVLNDMVCGSPEAISAGVECLCYATATQCVEEGPGSLCGWHR